MHHCLRVLLLMGVTHAGSRKELILCHLVFVCIMCTSPTRARANEAIGKEGMSFGAIMAAHVNSASTVVSASVAGSVLMPTPEVLVESISCSVIPSPRNNWEVLWYTFRKEKNGEWALENGSPWRVPTPERRPPYANFSLQNLRLNLQALGLLFAQVEMQGDTFRLGAAAGPLSSRCEWWMHIPEEGGLYGNAQIIVTISEPDLEARIYHRRELSLWQKLGFHSIPKVDTLQQGGWWKECMFVLTKRLSLVGEVPKAETGAQEKESPDAANGGAESR